MNDALLDGKGVHSKEAQFIEKTLDVGPGALIPVKAREKAVEQEQAVTAKAAPEKAEKADRSREVVASQAPDQTVTLGEEPGNQRRWTGKIVDVAEDRKSVDMQSAGKVSRVIDGQGKEFPAELKVGDYGKLLHSKTGPQFAAQEQQRGKEKGKGGREVSV
jgi:sarcosine oxidase gamma subunit